MAIESANQLDGFSRIKGIAHLLDCCGYDMECENVSAVGDVLVEAVMALERDIRRESP